MKADRNRLFGVGLIVVTNLLAIAAVAQESAVESFDPAVDTSAAFDTDDRDALQPGVDTSVDVSDRDALEPGVDTSATPAPAAQLAQGVTRNESGNRVMDEMTLGRTEITGNQELPTVLYIVPWQKSDPGDLMGRPVNTLLDEVLAPIDREEFVRQVDYYGDLYRGDEE